MKTDKREALRHISCLPEDAVIQDALYRIAFVQAVTHGLAAAERGEFATQDEVEKRMARWLKSAGR